MNKVQFHLILSDYSSISFPARMDGPCSDNGIALCLEDGDLIRAVHKGMRCRITIDKHHSMEGVVNSFNGLAVTCRIKERGLS